MKLSEAVQTDKIRLQTTQPDQEGTIDEIIDIHAISSNRKKKSFCLRRVIMITMLAITITAVLIIVALNVFPNLKIEISIVNANSKETPSNTLPTSKEQSSAPAVHETSTSEEIPSAVLSTGENSTPITNNSPNEASSNAVPTPRSQIPASNNSILIGVSSASHDFQRRQLIRKYQFDPYRNNDIDWRFFLSNPGEDYEEMIRWENSTYGDLIVLEDLEDTRETARQVKPFYYFTYVEKNLKSYKYVAKMDDDAFINVPLMTKDFLHPNRTGVAEYFGSMYTFPNENNCPQSMGWFYALSWDLMLKINEMFVTTKRDKIEEDFQVGWYLCQSKVNYTATTFTFDRCHDLSLTKNYNTIFYHPMSDDNVCIHQLKPELHYIYVAQCASSNGFNQTCIENRYKMGWK